MIQLLIDNPLLLLFAVASIGYLIGRIRIGGVSLGVAAVLFVGLGFGALSPELRLPEIVYLLGLVLFVYTIGLSSGPSFGASLRRKGLRDNLLVLGVITFAAGLTVVAQRVIDLSAPLAAGMFAGSLTNTPALASILEQLRRTGVEDAAALAEPVVGYSVAYPIGVLGMILAFYLFQRIWKIDYAAEAYALRDLGAGGEELISRTVRVDQPAVIGRTIAELVQEGHWDVVFGRIQHNGEVALATSETRLEPDDLVSVIGSAEAVGRVVEALGTPSPRAA